MKFQLPDLRFFLNGRKSHMLFIFISIFYKHAQTVELNKTCVLQLIRLKLLESVCFVFQRAHKVLYIYLSGYALSMVSLMLALCIFCCFRYCKNSHTRLIILKTSKAIFFGEILIQYNFKKKKKNSQNLY